MTSYGEWGGGEGGEGLMTPWGCISDVMEVIVRISDIIGEISDVIGEISDVIGGKCRCL